MEYLELSHITVHKVATGETKARQRLPLPPLSPGKEGGQQENSLAKISQLPQEPATGSGQLAGCLSNWAGESEPSVPQAIMFQPRSSILTPKLGSNTVSEDGPSDWRPEGQFSSLVSSLPQGCSGERLVPRSSSLGGLAAPYSPVF